MSETRKEKRKSRLHRTPRVLLFIFGIYTISWFWFSFTAIIIGISYMLFFSEKAWKRNGFVLAFSAAIGTYLAETMGVLYLAIGIVIVMVWGLSVGIIHVVQANLKKRGKHIRLYRVRKLPSRVVMPIKVIAIIFPISIWSVVSINFVVMFDNTPRLLWIHAPSTVKLGDDFDVTIEAWDQFERLSAVYDGRVDFSMKSYNLTDYSTLSSVDVLLPDSYSFTGQFFGSTAAYTIYDGKDNGRHIFTLNINTTGIHYLLVSDSYTGNTYYSNPIIVDNYTDTDSKIYWGDLHTHSMLSDGSGSAAHSFYYARYIACLDYYCLSDHGEHLDTFGLNLFNTYELLETATNAVYEPNKFVSFQGVEWTTGYITTFNRNFGHYACISSGDEIPLISANSQKTPDELWNYLDLHTSTTGDNILAIPHHTVRKSFIQDWTYVNSKYVRFAEVTSVHGECLFEPRHPLNYRDSVDHPPNYVNGSSVMDALIMGHKMALVANSDEHDGHPGHSSSHTPAYIGHQWPLSIWHPRNAHPYPGGLTAVYSTNLTRGAVFSGLYNQRVFSNSDHGRPILVFDINGTVVGDGSTFNATSQTGPRAINIFLAQDGAPIALKSTAAVVTPSWQPNWNATIEIIKNGLLWKSIEVSDPVVKITEVDTAQINGTSYQSSCVKIGDNYYINSYSQNPIDPSSLNTGGYDFYAIRVVGNNGRTSYSGPIWVEY